MDFERTAFERAIEKLADDFPRLNWNFELDAGTHEVISRWLGEADEEVMVCAFKGKKIDEQFHRQDFFFFNFAYKNSYEALSNGADSRITVSEGDCYIGQPFSGYALKGEREDGMVIVGVLIRRDVFFREYLSTLAQGGAMFRFFLDSERSPFSDSALHFPLEKDSAVWSVLGTMAAEYAFKKDDTQKVLKPLALALCMLLARKIRSLATGGGKNEGKETLSQQIVRYIADGSARSLSDVARHFGYHPNYVSALLRKDTGRTFSDLQLSARMEKARLLLSGTGLSVEEIAEMLGYGGTSNFYKAYRAYFGRSPRGK